MFSPIIILATNQITVTDEEIIQEVPKFISERSTIPRSISNTPNSGQYESPRESILSVLDDKNQTIANLKKQLQNQKTQLLFYLQKELNRSKIEELSESCTPQASEESLPLNLAINKFCRQAGIKTKLSLLHEHMSRLDYKISHLLRDQEFVLRKIVNKLCEFVKNQETTSYVDFKAEFGAFIMDPFNVDLFDKLLSATISLGRKLDCFKICCDRVLSVEEERNAIVEQVYSMPVEERINCNYLLGIQMEKAQLENEIRRISRHHAASRHRIIELNVIENILHNLQWELNSSFLKNEESCISKMVKKINSEAQLLLEMTKEQKRRFECEVSKTKCPDSNRILLYIKTASDGDKMDKKELGRCGIKTEEEIRLFGMVKGEIDILRNKIQVEANVENKKLVEDNEKLKIQITQALLESSRFKVSYSALKQELEELKLERKRGLQKIKQERDAYKSQVEDLQAIREAYAQLVDKQPNTSQMERDFFEQIEERNKKIFELESHVILQNQEIDKLRVKVLDQNDQIVVLKKFINLTRTTVEQVGDVSETDKFSSNSCSSKDIGNVLRHLSHRKGKYTDIKTNKEEIKKELNETKKITHRDRLPSPSYIRKKVLQESPKYSGGSPRIRKKSTKIKTPKRYAFDDLPQETKKNSLACVKICSQTNGKVGKTSDIVQTTITTNEHDNEHVHCQTSVFSMEIKFTDNDNKRRIEYDEFELFKDCSNESVILENYYGNLKKTMDYLN